MDGQAGGVGRERGVGMHMEISMGTRSRGGLRRGRGAGGFGVRLASFTALMLLFLADGLGATGGAGLHPLSHGNTFVEQFSGPQREAGLCMPPEALPLAERAPVAARDCEACKAPLIPVAVAEGGEQSAALDTDALALVRAFVSSGGRRGERAQDFAHGMMQLRLNRFFPSAVDLAAVKFRRRQEAVNQERAPALRHLLSARRAAYDELGPEVAVHPYLGDPEVRFSMMWRLGPDEYEICEESGENVSVCRLAFQPLHPKILSPLWQLRLFNVSDPDWNPNFAVIESPLQSRTVGDLSKAVNDTFSDLMQHLSLLIHLGRRQEQGDATLLSHMRQGRFGVRRERSAYEQEMDTRSFSHLLYRVAQAASAGNATVSDGILVLERMVEAGLEPALAEFASLMAVAGGMARGGSGDIGAEVDEVLDLMAHVKMPPENSIYMAAFEAIAWAARNGRAGMDEAEALACRMVEAEQAAGDADRAARLRVPPMQDPDLYACLLAVVAGGAQSGCADDARMNVWYEEDDDGMVSGRALEEGQAPLTWHAHAEHLMQRMRLAGLVPNSLVHHARLQVAVGSATRGEVDMEAIDRLLEGLLQDGLAFEHAHAHSILAATVAAIERGNMSLPHLSVVLDYVTSASLELDAVCYGLWLRGLAHGVRVRQAKAEIGDLRSTMALAHKHKMRFSAQALDFLSQAVADRVSLEVAGGSSLESLAEVRAQVLEFYEVVLYYGGSPPKCLFDARLLLQAEAGEAGQALSGLEAECLVEDMMVAGHSADAHTMWLMLRVLACSNARGDTGILDVARVIERGIAAKVLADEPLLLQTMAAAAAAAQHGGVSMADAEELLARAYMMRASLDINKAKVMGSVLAVAGAAAQHGLATVGEAVALVERMLQASREAGTGAPRLDMQQREALIAVLAGAARAGAATAEDAETVMRYLDVGGQRPSMRVLDVLLDVIVAEAVRGCATLKDAAHVMNRIKGCGFPVTPSHMAKLLSIVHASSQFGQARLADAEEVLRDLRASGVTPDAHDYLQVLDCAQWDAYWRAAAAPPNATSVAPAHAQVSKHQGSGGSGSLPGDDEVWPAAASAPVADDEWCMQTWHRMESIMGEATTQGLDLGAPAVIISARFAHHTRCTAALVAAWQMFRAVPPRARSALVYAELMGALGALGNTEGVVGLLRVAKKHGLASSRAMLLAAIEADPDPVMVLQLDAELSALANKSPLPPRAASIVEKARAADSSRTA